MTENPAQRFWGLPKWPAMTVQGDKVTPEQAGEILIRTNGWFGSCNDKEWERIVWETAGIKVSNGGYGPAWDSVLAFNQRHCVLELEYLRNARIMSSWVGGAKGWCDWEGNIYSTNYNIGKWPYVEEVFEEWKRIAEAFPFLKLRCQLWSGETCEDSIRPLIEFEVKEGTVRTLEPKEALLAPTNVNVVWPIQERGCTLVDLKSALALNLRDKA